MPSPKVDAGGRIVFGPAAVAASAAAGPGPAGVSNWQDDRTVFVFAVEAGA